MCRSKTDKRCFPTSSVTAGGKSPFLYLLLVCLCCLPVFSYTGTVCAGQNDPALSRSGFADALRLYKEGATDKAIDKMREVIKADPQNADAHEELGYMFLKKKEFDHALNAFRSALKINPRMRTARTGVGITLYEKGDLDGAQAALIDALVLNPYPSRAHYALGLVYEARNDYKKSIREYKEGLKTFVPGKR